MTDQQAQNIANEVRDFIEQQLATGGKVVADWIVTGIVGSWEPPGGVDADKWTTSGYANVRTIVRQVVRTYKPKEEEVDPQTVLPGYEKLHRAYLISRQGEQTIVRVDELSVAEALEIVAELTRCETGLRIHKNELLRYIDEVLLPRERNAS